MNLGDYWHIFVISMVPVVELRGAIPVGIVENDLPWVWVLLVAVVGNLVPVPFILFGMDWVVRVFGRIAILGRFFDWVLTRSRRKGGIVERYGLIGLMFFVAIPAPGTGAWTGSIVAVLLGIPFRQAAPVIVAGVVAAGIVVTLISVSGWVGAGIALAALACFVIVWAWRRSRVSRPPGRTIEG